MRSPLSRGVQLTGLVVFWDPPPTHTHTQTHTHTHTRTHTYAVVHRYLTPSNTIPCHLVSWISLSPPDILNLLYSLSLSILSLSPVASTHPPELKAPQHCNQT